MGEIDSVVEVQRQLSLELRGGDVVLDFQGVGLHEVAAAAERPIKAVAQPGKSLELVEISPGGEPLPQPLSGDANAPALLSLLRSSGHERLIVIAGGAPLTSAWRQALSQVQQAGVDVVYWGAGANTPYDEYMSPEDAEAVTTRLRQLGYL